MTTTNQAFIRVYRQDSAELGPAGPIVAHAGRQTSAALRTSVEFVAAAGFAGRKPGDSSSGAALIATSIDVLPPKAELPTEVPTAARARQRENRFAELPAGTSLRRVGPPNTPKRPLSSYIARQRATQALAAQDRSRELRPGTTVASFRWPAVCRALLQQSTTELDELADRIRPHGESSPAVVGVLGLFQGTGCTTMALCLAARLAARSQRVILVDGNFTSPRLAQLLDVVPTIGWQESLVSDAPTGDAIVRAVDDRIDVLALSVERSNDPLKLLARPQVAHVANTLRSAYEIVLVDLGAFFDPCSQPVALRLVSQLKIETVLAISGAEDADPRDLATLAEHLEQRGCKLAGVAENRFTS
jgi:Mrp family chromosome partitioning ATPase